MNKIIMFILVLLFIMAPMNVYAEEPGSILFRVDVETNPPEGLENYDFFVELMNETTSTSESYEILYYSNYQTYVPVPFGTYYVLSAGVVNDTLGKFDLAIGDSFTINEDTPHLEVTLGFGNFNVIENKQEQESVEPIVIPNDETKPIDLTQKEQIVEETKKDGLPKETTMIIGIIAIGMVLGVSTLCILAWKQNKKTKN